MTGRTEQQNVGAIPRNAENIFDIWSCIIFLHVLQSVKNIVKPFFMAKIK